MTIFKHEKMLYSFGYHYSLSTQLSLLTQPNETEYSLMSSPVIGIPSIMFCFSRKLEVTWLSIWISGNEIKRVQTILFFPQGSIEVSEWSSEKHLVFCKKCLMFGKSVDIPRKLSSIESFHKHTLGFPRE